MDEKQNKSELLAHQNRIEINLGYACNNRCRFCSESLNRRSEIGLEASKFLSTEYLLKKLEELREKGFIHLTFLGGEPTLRADFPELVRQAKKLGFETIFLTSNGRMLARPHYAEALFKAGLTRLYLSLHGPDATTHDAAVQVQGAFRQVEQALGFLRDGVYPFSFSSVIFTGNADVLPQLFDYQMNWAPKRIFWAFVRPAGAAREHFDELVPRYDQFDKALHEVVALQKNVGIPFTLAHWPLCRLAGIEGYCDELYWGENLIDRENEKFLEQSIKEKNLVNVMMTKGHFKVKHKDCAACRFVYICDGVHSEYARRRSFGEFEPVIGPVVERAEELWIPELNQDHNEDYS